MPRLSITAGSVILLAFFGVNAGPCRPSSSIVTTSLETTAAPTEVGESTASLASTSSTEPEVTETVSVSVSVTATTNAVPETTETADPTTTAAAETTTAAVSKCTAAPLPENPRACMNVPNPYMAPNCVSFDIACNTMVDISFGQKYLSATTFEECVSKCAEDLGCSGVQYTKAGSVCMSFIDSLGSTTGYPAYDVAYKRGE